MKSGKGWLVLILLCLGIMSFFMMKVWAQGQSAVPMAEDKLKSARPRMIEVEEAVWVRLNENFLKMQNELVNTKATLKLTQAELENLRKNKGNEKTTVSEPMAPKKLPSHRVQKKESLWRLAMKYYNDPYKWRWIYKENIKQIEDPNLIYPEQILDIPRY